MTTTKITTVFDTNSYRDLVTNKTIDQIPNIISELKELEQKKNIIAFGAPIVGMEMLSHLSDDPNGKHYNECLCGVRAMALHCSGEDLIPRFIAQPVLQYARMFFSASIPAKEEENKNIAGSIGDFGRDLKAAMEHHTQKSTFPILKAFLNKHEEQFAEDIIQGIEGAKAELKKLNPTMNEPQLKIELETLLKSQYFKDIQARAMITAVALLINHPDANNAEEIHKRALKMNEIIPLAAGFYCWVYYKVVHDNIDMKSKTSQKKRWNWLWDYQVSTLISESKIEGREVILVTRDTGIVEALSEYGYQSRVMNLEDYYIYLKN